MSRYVQRSFWPTFFPSSPARPLPPGGAREALGVSNLSDTVERGAPRARGRPIRVPSASPDQWQAPHCCPILSNGALRSNNRAGERLSENLAAPGNCGPAVRSVRGAPRGDAARRGQGRGFLPTGPQTVPGLQFPTEGLDPAASRGGPEVGTW